jgi:hypothetical protein
MLETLPRFSRDEFESVCLVSLSKQSPVSVSLVRRLLPNQSNRREAILRSKGSDATLRNSYWSSP